MCNAAMQKEQCDHRENAPKSHGEACRIYLEKAKSKTEQNKAKQSRALLSTCQIGPDKKGMI